MVEKTDKEGKSCINYGNYADYQKRDCILLTLDGARSEDEDSGNRLNKICIFNLKNVTELRVLKV